MTSSSNELKMFLLEKKTWVGDNNSILVSWAHPSYFKNIAVILPDLTVSSSCFSECSYS